MDIEKACKNEWFEKWFHVVTTVTHPSWTNISAHENITFDFINEHPEYSWNMHGMSKNPNITLEMMLQHPEKPWNWHEAMYNKNITITDILNNQDKPWDWSNVFRRDDITMDVILKIQSDFWRSWAMCAYSFKIDEQNFIEYRVKNILLSALLEHYELLQNYDADNPFIAVEYIFSNNYLVKMICMY